MLTDGALGPADVLLSDGSIAVVRPLVEADMGAVRRLHEDLSPEALRLRFFSASRGAARKYVDHLVSEHPLCLLLEQHGDVLAVATAELVPGTATCEISFVVAEGRHGLGAGTLLLEHLAATAWDRGLTTFAAEVLSENHAMLAVLEDAGFTMTRAGADGVTEVVLDLTPTVRSECAADARDRRSQARSLHPLLHPHSVAVVGVRGDGHGVGATVLDCIRSGGFRGDLVVVHPRAAAIPGVRAVRRFDELERPVDLAVIAVPAGRVLETAADAARAGVPAAVVLTSGFRELGRDGAGLEQQLLRLARDNGMRIVGPNCLGVQDNSPEVSLNATFSRCLPPDGELAVATQSGGVGIVLAELAEHLGLGIGSMVSLGNKVDVSGNDLIAAWTDDPRVGAAALYLESFGNARKFARLARTFSERKPLLAVVGGRSDGGHRAGASHTAAGATPAVVVAAMFGQAGVIACDGAEDLAQTALLLTREPRPPGPRLGIVSNAGGLGVLLADAAGDAGLTVPPLSEHTRGQLGAHVLGTVGTSNPVDAGAAVTPAALAEIVATVLGSGEVDAVLVELVGTGLTDAAGSLAALGEARRRHPALPCVVVVHAMAGVWPGLQGLTFFDSSAAAVRAMGRAARYSAWLAERRVEDDGLAPAPASTRHGRRATAASARASAAESGGWVGAEDSYDLLAAYGIAPTGVVVRGAEAAASAAADAGFPVAVKVAVPGVAHRTERGLVRVGLDDGPAVARVVTGFEQELGQSRAPVLVQPVLQGVEVAAGVVRDPAIGPMVMVGAGGVAADVLDDRAYLVPPVAPRDARRALRSLRCWPLLRGFRGSPPVDIDALVQVVVACGQLAEEVPEVAELDANPVVANAEGCGLVDVTLRLLADPEPAPGPRQLQPSRLRSEGSIVPTRRRS